MVLDITHPDKLTPTNKLDDVIYAHSHNVSGTVDEDLLSQTILDKLAAIESLLEALDGKTFEIPVLISRVSLSSAQSHTFNDLNGDVDGRYIIEFTGTTSGNYGKIIVKPNNIGTSQLTIVGYWFINDMNKGRNTGFLLGTTEDVSTSQLHAKATLYAKTGKNRFMESLFGNYGSQSILPIQKSALAQWLDTTTNITSLVITTTEPTNQTITGDLSLYKIVEITL